MEFVTQAGFIAILLALFGYIVVDFFDFGYGRTYRPKGGDLDRFLHYSSRGIVIIFLFLIFLLYSDILKVLVDAFFPLVTPELLLASFGTYTILLLLLLFILILSPFGGLAWRFVKRDIIQTKVITIKTNDNNEDITVNEIYDEDADYFFFLDKNENWGLIKKSLVNRIESERKERIKSPKNIL
jgi:hypothetical protein